MEYIIVENGIITAHRCGATKPENAIEVPSGFPGYIGLQISAIKDDLTGIKPLSQQVAEGIVTVPEGYKINDADTEFIRMEQEEIDQEYPPKTYALEGSFDAIEVSKTFDRFGKFGYWTQEGLTEMKTAQPSKAHKAVNEEWVLDEDKAAEIALSQAKSTRTDAVAAITVEVDGMVFDGNETAQARMERRVGRMKDGHTTKWVLANNEVALVTKEQLDKALSLANDKQTELWIKPYE